MDIKETLMRRLVLFSYELRRKNENLIINDSASGKQPSRKERANAISDGIPEDIVNNFDAFYGFKLRWEAKPETGIRANGSVNIMELPIIFSDWEGQAYVPNTPENSPLRNFKIVDFAYDEYATGIIFDENKDFTFYLIELDGSDPVNLDLDINGYIEMMIYSKGYGLWQRVIEHLLYGKYYKEHTEQFKENMPKLFPDWTWEGWLQKFEEVRLNNVK